MASWLSVGLLVVVGCGGTGSSSPNNLEGATVRIVDAEGEGTDWAAGTWSTHICVQCEACSSTSLSGTYGESPILPLDSTTPAACPAGSMEGIAAHFVSNGHVELRGNVESDGLLDFDLPVAVVAPRTAIPPANPLCAGQDVTLTWDPASDLQPGETMVKWAEQRNCSGGSTCEGDVPDTFSTMGTIDPANAAIDFTVPAEVTTSRSGILTTTPLSVPDEGTVECPAKQCSYSFSHTVQLGVGFTNC